MYCHVYLCTCVVRWWSALTQGTSEETPYTIPKRIKHAPSLKNLKDQYASNHCIYSTLLKGDARRTKTKKFRSDHVPITGNVNSKYTTISIKPLESRLRRESPRTDMEKQRECSYDKAKITWKVSGNIPQTQQ